MSADRWLEQEHGTASAARISRKLLYKPGPARPFGAFRKPALPDEQGAEAVIYSLDLSGRITRTGFWPTSDRDWCEVRELSPLAIPLITPLPRSSP